MGRRETMDAEGAKLGAIWHLTKISDLEAHVGGLKEFQEGCGDSFKIFGDM